jgi:hypothetical protein
MIIPESQNLGVLGRLEMEVALPVSIHQASPSNPTKAQIFISL